MTSLRSPREALCHTSLTFLLGACAGSDGDAGGGDSSSSSSSSSSGDTGATTTEVTTSSDGDSSTTGAGADSSTGEGLLPPANLVLMESVIFYDGYAATVDEPVPEHVIRLSNSLYATRLTEDHLSVIQPNLQMQVLIGALCDNYDRIGSVQLALVPKGAETYDPAEVQRLELARFITPFMDKNKDPDTVPYAWDIDDVAAILTDPDLQAEHDFWMELDVFGVPYAANEEISGCAGRNDVFRGWLALYTDSTEAAADYDAVIPLAIKEAFNNYQAGASDMLGTTRKTVEITLEEDAEDAQLVLITSNHGANAGGEEYNRREHYVYLDGELALQYIPGRDSCEPFRMYNTQGNGIYGPTPMSDEEWQSFSNWCPGDVIDTRMIQWGPVAAGTHELVIDVPDAMFVDGQGDIPFSLYLQRR
jgi:Peptide-N-glycosidase F, C terminal/Peptide-N-glycosidase F, N terminal